MPPRKPSPGKKPTKAAAPSTILFLRLTPEYEAALQAFIGRQRVTPSRNEAGLLALKEMFEKEGVWPRSR